MKTQGTHLFVINPSATGGPEVVRIACVTSIDGVEAPRDQLESTCLESLARTYVAGMATPGQMTFGLNFEPQDETHQLVYDLWTSGTSVELAIGFGDGTSLPTLDSDDQFDLPTSRSWMVLHDSFFANVPVNFALNALVAATVSVQLSGFPELIGKA